MNNRTRNTRLALAIAGAALGATALTGCSGHGTHTKEAISSAETRYSQLRSATDWEMAKQQYLAGEFPKAIKTVDSAIALNPEVEKSHTLRAQILIERGELEKARESLIEAMRLDADAVEPVYYMGILMERFNRPGEALGYYSKAMERDASNPQYVVAAGEMMIETGDLDGARNLLQTKRDQFRFNAAMRQLEGRLAMLADNPEEAVAAFREGQLLANDDLMMLEELARAQIEAGNIAEAEFNLRRLIDSSEQPRPDLRLLRARCLMMLDRAVEARTMLLELSRDPAFNDDFAFWMDMGSVAATINDEARLRTAATRAISLRPDRHEGYMLRAMYLRKTGKFDDALKSVAEAITRTSQDHAPLVLKSLILQDMGRPTQALRTLQLAAKMAPNDPAIARFIDAANTDPAFAGVDTNP